jgi:hypothetical protein
MVGPGPPDGEAGMALPPGGYGPGMPDIDAEEIAEEVEEEKQDQVLKREGLEEELMQEGRSDEAENIAAVETGEENL